MTPISFHVTKKALYPLGRVGPGVMTLRVVNGGCVAIHDHACRREEGGREGKLRGARPTDSSPFPPPLIMLLARATTPEPFVAADSLTYTSKTLCGAAPTALIAERFVSPASTRKRTCK